MDSYKLDQTDLSILNLLQNDAGITHREIAAKTHRTINPINERVARLKRLGYIKKTVAIIDIKKVKSLFTAYTLIQLNKHTKENFQQFKQSILSLPEIVECSHVIGQYDFILKIMVADLHAYNDFLRDHIATQGCIIKVESFPMLDEFKHEIGYQF